MSEECILPLGLVVIGAIMYFGIEGPLWITNTQNVPIEHHNNTAYQEKMNHDYGLAATITCSWLPGLTALGIAVVCCGGALFCLKKTYDMAVKSSSGSSHSGIRDKLMGTPGNGEDLEGQFAEKGNMKNLASDEGNEGADINTLGRIIVATRLSEGMIATAKADPVLNATLIEGP
jgi:hypothetical protein